jgi:hypothetical protein
MERWEWDAFLGYIAEQSGNIDIDDLDTETKEAIMEQLAELYDEDEDEDDF